MDKLSLTEHGRNDFVSRHIGSSQSQQQHMLNTIEAQSLDALIEQTIPTNIRLTQPLELAKPLSEHAALEQLTHYATRNKRMKNFIGQGYYNTYTPSVIQRNLLENPGWYTAYTPYQAEISQGRLESLLNFQQMVVDLTAMDVANASLLDEATAAAEAMTLSRRVGKNKSMAYFVLADVHPQTIDVVKTRAEFLGITIIVGTYTEMKDADVFGVLMQNPSTTGGIKDLSSMISSAKANQAIVTVATDLLACTLIKPPGEMGADIAIGSAQRFGVPMGFGGPHAGFMATVDDYKRNLPGRIIGVSVDRLGNKSLRMAMQTREQHIRREKATSNICTAQALLANIAACYAVYHGPEGLKKIAKRIHLFTSVLAYALAHEGYRLSHQCFFDTLTIQTDERTETIEQKALKLNINLRQYTKSVGVSFDETTQLEDLHLLWAVFDLTLSIDDALKALTINNLFLCQDIQRSSRYLTQAVFNSHQSETLMLRYLKRLENKDYSLTHGMIPLGSCTMKLNATTEMMPISWPEFNQIHPFAPKDQALGYHQLAEDLKAKLCVITGYDAFSLQPNSGASGEYAGLIAIKRYQQSIGQGHRNVCLIPSSAHGTNPASAAMLSMKVVVVACDNQGNIDLLDLQSKVDKHRAELSAIMVTYPSTHGVFEENIREICAIIHQAGGQVYLDGANMNAQVGLTSPGFIGADVSHLNLHKTFCIPHGGGGPGVGPIGVKAHLAPFLPGHVEQGTDGSKGAVAAADLGSASLLPISWAYIAMMGAQGLTQATKVAILHANYIMVRLQEYYPVLYKGTQGRVAHECIIDLRPIKQKTGIDVEDVAKRLMDYGFHAPTMSFPVAGTLMIEPTESEDLQELDRFCDAMIAIYHEIEQVAQGTWPKDDNPLVNAPHSQQDLISTWTHPYSIETACFPSPSTRFNKYWPSVTRVDNVYGDRNLACCYS